MSVSDEYRAWVLEQLRLFGPVAARSMFGGVGLYHEGLFFGVIDDDVLYFKTDDSNRPDYEAAGSRPFQPMGEGTKPMAYHEVPVDVVEDPDRLREWAEKAADAARRKGKK